MIVQHQKSVAGDVQLAHLTDSVEAVLFEAFVVVGQRVTVHCNVERFVWILPENLEQNGQLIGSARIVWIQIARVGQLPFFVVRGSLAFVALLKVERSNQFASDQFKQSAFVGRHSVGAKVGTHDIAKVHAQMMVTSLSDPARLTFFVVFLLDISQIVTDVEIDLVDRKHKNDSLIQTDGHIVSQPDSILANEV